MNPRDIAIATMTLARDEDGKRALHAALRDLAASSVPVFVTDGGSGEDFVESLRALENVSVCAPCGDGLWPQVERSLMAARDSGARFVLYTEPDKRDFFRERLRSFIEQAPDAPETGIVLATRAPPEMATFPRFQQYTESVINRCCAEVIGHPCDYSYGPFLISPAVLSKLARVDRKIAWGWRPYAFGIAHRLGLRVESLALGCACPADQREDGERVYRMLQLAQSVEGLIKSTQARLE